MIVLLTLSTVVILILATGRRSQDANISQTPNLYQTAVQESPEGWKKLEIKNSVEMRLPPDMKPTSPMGDSYSYREAYNNGPIDLTIVYGVPIVRLLETQQHFLQPSCLSPPNMNEISYQETFVSIDGRTAKLSIDHTHKEEFIAADVCFAKTDNNKVPLRVIAYCKDEAALKIAQQIFNSIRFKDKN